MTPEQQDLLAKYRTGYYPHDYVVLTKDDVPDDGLVVYAWYDGDQLMAYPITWDEIAEHNAEMAE